MKRIFVAINLPENIKNTIEEKQLEIQNLFPEEVKNHLIKWVPRENFHITLLFLGAMPENRITQLEDIISQIAISQKPLQIKLKKIVYGPPQKIPPRLVWLTIAPNKVLQEIAQQLQDLAFQQKLIFKKEKRTFSPHITLGRIKAWIWKRINPEERPDIYREINQEFKAVSIDIMESRLKRSGAEYFLLKTIPLKTYAL